ncbi:MAG: hypothetical protein HY420_02530 [Candidatus Kerfeldbacteria bacterium]|nr:hypothetical protein [Candidatus Kerfeldbacteria bacterium]
MLPKNRAIRVGDVVRIPCDGTGFAVVRSVSERRMEHWASKAVVPWIKVRVVYFQRHFRDDKPPKPKFELPAHDCTLMRSLPYSTAVRAIGQKSILTRRIKTRYQDEQGMLVGIRRWISNGARRLTLLVRITSDGSGRLRRWQARNCDVLVNGTVTTDRKI